MPSSNAPIAFPEPVGHLIAMTTIHLVPDELRELYHVREWRNAAGVLATACPNEWQDVIDVLLSFRLLRSEIQAAGGRKSPIANQIDGGFYGRGWQEKQFQTAIKIDDELFESPTHKIDCLKGRVALEVEWNNKDPFFDRDLNNFRLLFDLRAIDVGIIITRATELQAIFKSLDKGTSYGSSTTHHEKLWPRIEGGGGGGCPIPSQSNRSFMSMTAHRQPSRSSKFRANPTRIDHSAAMALL